MNRGRPPELGLRLVATLAIDLFAQFKLRDQAAAAAIAWETLQQLEAASKSAQYAHQPEWPSLLRLMREVRAGKAIRNKKEVPVNRIEISPFIWREALKRLPEDVRPTSAEIAFAFPPRTHSAPDR